MVAAIFITSSFSLHLLMLRLSTNRLLTDVRCHSLDLFDDPAVRSGFVASVIGKDVGLD